MTKAIAPPNFVFVISAFLDSFEIPCDYIVATGGNDASFLLTLTHVEPVSAPA
jgi:hypothetical protein